MTRPQTDLKTPSPTGVRRAFADQATITIQAGRGGKGCHSFYRDLWTRHPLSDGGNGGRGGDVRVRANPQLTTLLDFQSKRHFKGGPGSHGSSKRKQGAQGSECFIDVPLGTILRDTHTGDLIRELLNPDEEVIVAKGGAGGIGNGSQSKSRGGARVRSKRGALPKRPVRFDPELLEGKAGEGRQLSLELKFVADVGIIGMPNAGKSTLIRQISQARPKVASFPFTTLHPVLGAVPLDSGGGLVAVDVPGLIEGAHKGKGLGFQFLRHIERTRLLVHLIDMASEDGRDPVEDFSALNEELMAYREEVAAKPRILVANKMDCPQAKKNLTRFEQALKVKPLAISAKTGEGVEGLLEEMARRVKRMKKDG